jgi:hypothetical protein
MGQIYTPDVISQGALVDATIEAGIIVISGRPL